MNFKIIAILFSLCLIGGPIAALEENSEKVDAGRGWFGWLHTNQTNEPTPQESNGDRETAAAEPAETPDLLGSGEVEEERLRLENFKRLEKSGVEKIAQQHEIDKAWIERYESVFFGSQSIDTEELIGILRDLYRTFADTSNSRELKSFVQNVFNLIKMSYSFANNCNNGDFERYNTFIDKYSKSFGESIKNYAQYHRSKFLRTCNKTFSDILKLGDASAQSTESEAFSIVDRILANDPWPTKEPWLMKQTSSLMPGILAYTRSKLGNKAHKDVQIEILFGQTIKPVCSSVVGRFTGYDEIVELIKGQEEVRRSLDERGTKWLTALRICELIGENLESLQSKTHSLLLEQHREHKGPGCLGALLRKKS